MMKREEAVDLAREFFEDAISKSIIQKGIISERDIFCHENYVIVPWDSAAFLKEGKWEERMIGNVPIEVDRKTGRCKFMGIGRVMGYRELGFPV
ncbi:hypothetical protein ACFWTE_04990 [Nocardiopsis sp. NPDC058631]|uniref:hypothetical protein n=1 Tax=Nocardiopsis sp. NPDC058631 TaxID=3346566 RepID=UPI00365C42EA